MDSAAWKRLTSPILDDAWRLRKTLAYLTPIKWTLHGMLGEGSASSAGFYLWVVRMPLFVPSTVVSLNWSERYGGGTQIYDEKGETTHQALTGAMRVAKDQAADRQLVPDPPGGADNVRMEEVRGYGLFLKGNADAALEFLGRVARYDAQYAWEREFVSRATEMRKLISEHRHTEVTDQLTAWRSESLRVLGLDAT
jgi:hypothetical protein